MDLKHSLNHLWVFQLFLMLSKQNKIPNDFNNLKLNSNAAIDKVTVNIIRNCYCQNANTVLSGDWRNNDVFARNGAFATFPPLYKVGINGDHHFKRHRRLKNVFELDIRVVRKKKYPSSSFILMVSSNDTLTLALKMLKESILWNHEGFFLIVYKNTAGDWCSSVKSLLHLAWKFRLLYVTLLCYDDERILRLFTFNPYMQFAPKFWKFVHSHVERESDWTLYQHELNSSSTILYPSICKNLNFKKARNLGGYEVRIGAYIHPRYLLYDKRKTGMHRFGGVNGEISLAVWSFLNASPRVQLYARPVFVDDNGSLQSILQDLLTGKIEISVNMNLMRDFWRLQSYPHEIDGFCLVSRREHLHTSTSESLRLVLRPQINWPVLLAAGLALVVVLKLLTRRSLSMGALELARMLAAVPTHSSPQRPASRLLLVLFALSTMLLGSGFRGELTSFDVTPRFDPAIEIEADLIRSGLHVYGSVDYDKVLRNVSLKQWYHYGTYDECLERLAKGQRIACVTWCNQAGFHAREDDTFHLSKGLRWSYLAFSITEDWPLYSRFNEVLRRLTEGGLIKYYRNRQADWFRHDKKVERHCRQILRRNMKVNLQLWCFGVVIATLMFFVEIFFYMVKDHLNGLGENLSSF